MTVEMSWIEKMLAGVSVTTEGLLAYNEATNPDSPGGEGVTTGEVFSVGLRMLAKMAEATGSPAPVVTNTGYGLVTNTDYGRDKDSR